MAELAFITETGAVHLHVVCRCTFSTGVEWYGFGPSRKTTPYGQGGISQTSREHLINHLIAYDISDTKLRQALEKVSPEYENATYALIYRDCVSFATDLAREVGLTVPKVNPLPAGLLLLLKTYNPGYKQDSYR